MTPILRSSVPKFVRRAVLGPVLRSVLAPLAAAPLAAALLAAAIGPVAARAQQAAPAAQLTLRQAVARALQSDRELTAARLKYQAAQREAAVARATFRPNLFAGSGAAYTSGFPILAGGGAPAAFNLSYTQDFFDPLARADQHAAEQRSEQQRLAVDAMRDTVIVRAASAYLELAKVRRELDLLHDERASAQKILDYTRQRSEAGYELPIEITRAQLTSARVEQRIAQLEDQEDNLTDQLRAQLGLAVDQPIQVVAEEIPAEADHTVNDLVAEALKNNVELKQAESQQLATATALHDQRQSRWPTIGLIGQYNLLTKYNNYTEFFNKFEANNFVLGASVRIPIFSARANASIAFAKADLSASNASVESKRSQLSLDVRHQARHAREMDTTREVARLEMSLAEQNMQVLQSQFNAGRATLRDLEAAQLDQNDKSLAYMDADFARAQAQLDLLRSTGQVASLFQ